MNRDTSEVSLPDAPNWYVVIAPVNALYLPGEDLIDDTKLAHIIEKNEAKNESATGAVRWVATLPLAGRDLTGANLSSADVRHVDFSDAILNRASLSQAWAKKAHFDNAHLQGAFLRGAHLPGAWLDEAQLQGAYLAGAQFQGAWLGKAHLQCADFADAQLQSAWLGGAHLPGASLYRAQLQGAVFNGAQLQGASFVNACVWRADTRKAAWKDTMVLGPRTGPKTNKDHECDWTAARFLGTQTAHRQGGSRRLYEARHHRKYGPTL
jgi:uncharacterized protein YjbI with pentapeptide repeats